MSTPTFPGEVEKRLYLFKSGDLSCWQQWIKLNEPSEQRFVLPVPFYLVTHPLGNILIDGGNAPAAAVDHVKHWGPESTGEGGFTVHMRPDEACVPQLKANGFDPKDVRYILQSHLHCDHTGAMAVHEEFPEARILVSRSEWEYAHTPEWPHQFDFVKADMDVPLEKIDFIERHEDGYDVFGDGTVRLWQTPGHTFGHFSTEVTLPETGSVIICGDAVYTKDHWDEISLPGSVISTVETCRSVRKLKRIAHKNNSTVLFGHDQDQWNGLRHAPLYYS